MSRMRRGATDAMSLLQTRLRTHLIGRLLLGSHVQKTQHDLLSLSFYSRVLLKEYTHG